LVRGKSPGWFTIRAIGGSDTAVVRGLAWLLYAEVWVRPTTLTMGIGGTEELSTTVYAGNDVLLSNADITWRSLSPNIASVSAKGLVTALGVGNALIIADYAEPSDASNPVWCRANDASGSAYVSVVSRGP
jgi:uncharacterized protein YjdB